MVTIKCNNDERKEVAFWCKGGDVHDVHAFAFDEKGLWFEIGVYTSVKRAKNGAICAMRKYGFTFDKKEMNELNLKEF